MNLDKTENIITVRVLKRLLAELPPEADGAVIVLASDAEGNEYSPLEYFVSKPEDMPPLSRQLNSTRKALAGKKAITFYPK